jgi:hypothetical protein
MKIFKNVVPAFFSVATLAAAVVWLPAAQAQDTTAAKPASLLSDPCPIAVADYRGKNFYEVLFMNRDASGSGGVGNYYNSLGLSFEASPEVMDARFRALDKEKLKQEFGSDGVAFNGPRRFVANGFSVNAYDGCKQTDIGTIPFRLLGTFQTANFEAMTTKAIPPFIVQVSKRTSEAKYNAGEEIYELITPEGAVYTMFSLSLRIDPNNTLESLPTLDKRLTLPEGWSYRVRTLKEDLVLKSTYDSNPPNTIVMDTLENNFTFNGTGK